jgi:hypothetical protein
MATTTQLTPDHEPARTGLEEGEHPDDRDERPLERLDRNEVELMGELRVAATGIQVLLAFLLIVPFNARWGRVSSFDRDVYFVTLLCIASAAALLIAPTVHHRVLFRRGEKGYLVELGNRSAIIAMALLTVGLTGILVLISHVLFGGAAAIIVGAVTLCGVGALWFGVPLVHSWRG